MANDGVVARSRCKGKGNKTVEVEVGRNDRLR